MFRFGMVVSTYFQQVRMTHLKSCGWDSSLLWIWNVYCKRWKE